MDGNGAKRDSSTAINTGHAKLKTKVEASLLTQQEKLLLANREKDKGNEAFRAKDYEEAVMYFSRSISVIPTVAAYNNRAQAQIHLRHWHKAMKDCQTVLELEPGNMKALLRHANVLKNMGNYQMAAEDLRIVLSKEQQNSAARKLLVEIEMKMRECHPQQQSKGKKILIQEEEDDGDEPNTEHTDTGNPLYAAHCCVVHVFQPSPTTMYDWLLPVSLSRSLSLSLATSLSGSLPRSLALSLSLALLAHPVQPSQPVGGEESSTAPVERRDMGNAQKKPHSRGDGSPHSETSSNSHHRHWMSKGDKYKVTQESQDKVVNGTGKRDSTASVPADQSSTSKGTPAGGNVNLDAPCGALPPPLARLKNEGNLLFKNGQFADAMEKYSQAIEGFTDSGIDSPEDLCILYSNRAACYLKDGNCQECILDCTRALELQPFSLKPLLRRAMAYESLERYHKAYVDYKTVLQINISVQTAHDSVNRITKLLIEQDGPKWREKLPQIPMVPISAQQHQRQQPPSTEVLHDRAEKAARDAERKAEVCFTTLKQEGNEFVKKGQYQDAVGKYSECLKIKTEDCAIYTNRALCYLKLERFAEAKEECDIALKLEPNNKKAFYRRAMANKGLKDYLGCCSDLQEVLLQDPSVQEAERELEEVTALLRQSSADTTSPAKPRKNVPITEVGGNEQTAAVPNPENCGGSQEFTINLHPTNAYEFGQALNAARCRGDMAACADLLSSTDPEMLPQFLSTQLDGQTISFIVNALDTYLLDKDPNLIYQFLSHLHTTDRFSVVLMLLEKDERQQMTQLFEHLSAVECTEFTRNDVQNLANKYI
ncbi:sperm-associated antigen 1 [Genypterus blacodes]|uniref:sperm-associated antigen 1 n=1 Tax=Genypterus blacodes TaxID=154954 RepID=UPI003F767C6E